jgi:lipopolysaccharide biosynthesis regulator YciM
MSQRIELPPGCKGLDFPDGSRYGARPGTHVMVEDHHADQIKTSIHDAPGVLRSQRTHMLATKAGRWCVPCRFAAQIWSVECPKCGRPTTLEGVT